MPLLMENEVRAHGAMIRLLKKWGKGGSVVYVRPESKEVWIESGDWHDSDAVRQWFADAKKALPEWSVKGESESRPNGCPGNGWSQVKVKFSQEGRMTPRPGLVVFNGEECTPHYMLRALLAAGVPAKDAARMVDTTREDAGDGRADFVSEERVSRTGKRYRRGPGGDWYQVKEPAEPANDLERLGRHVRDNPSDHETRRIYADALDEAGKRRTAQTHRSLAKKEVARQEKNRQSDLDEVADTMAKDAATGRSANIRQRAHSTMNDYEVGHHEASAIWNKIQAHPETAGWSPSGLVKNKDELANALASLAQVHGERRTMNEAVSRLMNSVSANRDAAKEADSTRRELKERKALSDRYHPVVHDLSPEQARKAWDTIAASHGLSPDEKAKHGPVNNGSQLSMAVGSMTDDLVRKDREPQEKGRAGWLDRIFGG
jgi:uncharacterized protein (TIGR02996 family)